MKIKYFHIGLVVWIFAAVPLVFAEDFQDQPTLSELNETVEKAIVGGLALEERDVVVSRDENFLPYCGHWESYFNSLQHELEDQLAVLFIDHVNGPLTTNHTAFLYFTQATWREEAGLNTNGFRRLGGEGTNFSYGQAQLGDVLGAWIYEDVEAGYSALKWTYWTNRSIAAYEQKSSFGVNYGACISDWSGESWVTNTGSQQYSADATLGYDMYWRWNASRSRIKDTLTFPTNCADRSMDVYMSSTPTPEYDFYDFDDWGVGSGEYFKYDEVAAFSETTYNSGWIGSIDTCPWALVPEPPLGQVRHSWNASPYYITKWDFTYKKAE